MISIGCVWFDTSCCFISCGILGIIDSSFLVSTGFVWFDTSCGFISCGILEIIGSSFLAGPSELTNEVSIFSPNETSGIDGFDEGVSPAAFFAWASFSLRSSSSNSAILASIRFTKSSTSNPPLAGGVVPILEGIAPGNGEVVGGAPNGFAVGLDGTPPNIWFIFSSFFFSTYPFISNTLTGIFSLWGYEAFG